MKTHLINPQSFIDGVNFKTRCGLRIYESSDIDFEDDPNMMDCGNCVRLYRKDPDGYHQQLARYIYLATTNIGEEESRVILIERKSSDPDRFNTILGVLWVLLLVASIAFGAWLGWQISF